MRIQRIKVETPRTYAISGMETGEVYKHPGLPDLYMKVEVSDGVFYIVNLVSGRRAAISDSFVSGWIHCPNAVCKEEE